MATEEQNIQGPRVATRDGDSETAVGGPGGRTRQELRTTMPGPTSRPRLPSTGTRAGKCTVPTLWTGHWQTTPGRGRCGLGGRRQAGGRMEKNPVAQPELNLGVTLWGVGHSSPSPLGHCDVTLVGGPWSGEPLPVEGPVGRSALQQDHLGGWEAGSLPSRLRAPPKGETPAAALWGHGSGVPAARGHPPAPSRNHGLRKQGHSRGQGLVRTDSEH